MNYASPHRDVARDSGELWRDPVAASDGAGREFRVGVILVVLFFGGFIGWASFARLDAAAYAQGTVSVAGHRQSIQHKDGGIISSIDVHDGTAVRAGQLLMSLAPAEVEAAERAMGSQVVGLLAQRARLRAEQAGSGSVAVPVEFADLPPEGRADAMRALALQRAEFVARGAALAAQRQVLVQRSAQLDATIVGYHRESVTTREQHRLIGEELVGMQALASKGYASLNRVRALERAQAGLDGQGAELDANVARSQAQIGEVQSQTLSLGTDRMREVAKDLRATELQLNDLLPKLHALRMQLAQTRILAPVAGRVVAMTMFTVGGVVAPGQRLMDIVPLHRALVIDAQLAPNDSDGVHVGQSAEVKITSIHDRSLPILTGTVTRLSADSLIDERSGQHYFTLEVDVLEAEVNRIKSIRGADGGLRAGQPVQVVIPMRKRTALQYLTEPLFNAMWQSFRER
jgi:HlyD family secretion protein